MSLGPILELWAGMLASSLEVWAHWNMAVLTVGPWVGPAGVP